MAESIQRVKRRMPGGQCPATPQQVIGSFEAVARHWSEAATPLHLGGKRDKAQDRQRERHRWASTTGIVGMPTWSLAA